MKNNNNYYEFRCISAKNPYVCTVIMSNSTPLDYCLHY